MTQIINISAKDLEQLLKTEEIVIVDVREPAEYKSEAIKGSKNLPLSQVTIDTTHLPEHKHKKLVIHCKAGKRSMMACEKLKAENAPFNLYNLEGGIDAWKAAGLPIVESGKKIIPLDRQTQIAIGLLIVGGSLLGNFVNYNWFILPGIIGLGLLNAGITGWCGMAKLIAKMPWNQK